MAMNLPVAYVLATTIIVAASERITQRKTQRIVGGVEAGEGVFRYFGEFVGEFQCGSALIHEDILVSAAHCCPPTDCGIILDSVESYRGTVLEVEKYIMHPDYNYNRDYNDIMLMKLRNPSDITPVGYNTDDNVPGDDQEVTVIGYGKTENSAFSDVLLQVTVNAYSREDCAASWGNEVVDDIMLCAAADGRDSCVGDSGGPLLDADDGTGNVVGLSSFGAKCAGNLPGVYTRISQYDAWIQEVICCMSDNPPDDCECTSAVEDEIYDCTDITAFSFCEFGNRRWCLSPDATALVEAKGKVAIKDVVVGDKVMTASGQYKPVYTISHSHPDKSTTFLRLHTDNDDENPLELTAQHMLFLEGKRDPVPAKDVKTGDFLQTLHGPKEVTSISSVTRNGFYNPVTTDGTIVVDGIIVSTYTSLNGGSYLEIAGKTVMSFQSLFDMMAYPYREFCTIVSFDLCNQLGKQNDKPVAVNFMMEFYEFWSQQNMVAQFVIFFAFVVFFGLARIMLSPIGLAVISGFIWMLWRHLSIKRLAPANITDLAEKKVN